MPCPGLSCWVFHCAVDGVLDLGPAVRETPEGCLLSLKVVPRSSRNQVVGVENGMLKVKLQAPPVEGAANEAVLRFLADRLDCPRGGLEILKGAHSRHKWVRVRGFTAAGLSDALGKLMEKGK